jgi:D-sedoheptulose 7-phosphate isomerase
MLNEESKLSTIETPVSKTPSTMEAYFSSLCGVLRGLPMAELDQVRRHILRAYHDSRTIFVLGNGGSAATASHMICDLNKGTIQSHRKLRFRVLALTDNVPSLTAWANDSSYDDVFSEQLANFVQPRDVVLAISGSGNSANVLRALEYGRQAGAATLGLTGFNGGKMKDLCDVCVIVPSDNMQLIEDAHHSIAHSLFTAIREELSQKAMAAIS